MTVTTGAESVVSDVLTAAAGEWDVDPEEVELSFAGDALRETDRLADHGVVANSELEMAKKQFRIFSKSWFVDVRKREKLVLWIRDHITENLCLDTPTFAEDGCLTVYSNLLPSDAKQVAFFNSNCNNTDISLVTTIGDDFLSCCEQITSLDFSGLNNVTTIGDDFLYCCAQITSLDLSGLNSVTTIGDSFLRNCSKITSLDLYGLSSVTSIGNDFLSECSEIISLDLSGLSSVTSIGNYFFSGCSQITSLDLSGLSSVTTIGNGFLYSCQQISSLDLSGLSSVTTIGNCFLTYCKQITSLDLSGLGSVTTIDNYCFLSECNDLKSVQLPESNSALFEEPMKAAIDHSG